MTRKNGATPRPRGAGLGFTIGRKPRSKRPKVDLNWETGLPIPNTLDFWLLQAFRRKSGVVLDAAKVREAVERLGILQPISRNVRDLVVP